MERNSLLERRYSLNATHIANPIAESTCLTFNGASTPTHFPWGGIPISPKNRSNSSICLTSSCVGSNVSQNGGHQQKTNHKNSTTFYGHLSNATRMNSSKIDPRIYADVQSKGLASRIVKYHEKGTRLNRSLSVNNLYNKPGQFPVVHLKKTELPCRATKQNLSMTRIAPPEKSMFYGNTLSSIIRSNSIVSLHKSDEEISRENRPILHPPPTGSELAPTRSVLEVLKEISRKRISSDDLDTNDSMKKYCNREINEPTNFVPPNKTLHTFQSHKRQREHLSSPQQKREQQFNMPKQQNTSSFPTQHSPEQIAKKRLCSYNNDITSSLSSSQIYANKRKLYDNKKAHENITSVRTEYETNSTKRFQRGSDQEAEIQITSNYKQTPTLQKDNLRSPTRSSPNTTNNIHTSCALPQRTMSEPFYTAKQNNAVPKTKQKLTLFNKNYDECKEPVVAEDKADDEFSGIPFVIPKKSISSSGTKNPAIERTQKSKLALMLSGLRGELQNDEDEVDVARKNGEKQAAEQNMKTTALNNSEFAKILTSSSSGVASNTISTTKSSILEKPTTTATTFTLPDTITTAPITPTTTASNNTLPKITPILGFKSTTLPLQTVAKTQEATTSPSLLAKTSPLVGIKLTPQTTTVAPATTIAPTAAVVPTFGFGTATTVNANSSSAATTSLPILGGFSFNATAKNNDITATPTLDGGFNFHAANATDINNKAAYVPTAGPTSTSPSTYAFGNNTLKTTSPPTQTNTQNFGETTSSVTFGSLEGTTTTTNAATQFAFATPVVSAAAPSKSLEQTTITSNATALASASQPAAIVPTTTTAGTFSFGNAPVAITTASAVSSTTNSFSFGLNSSMKPAAVAKPFSINTEQTNAQAASNNFAFGSNAALKPLANITNNFTFGSAVTVTSAPAQSSNSFGFGANKQTNPSQFPFGGAATAATTVQTSAFAPASNSINNFGFGGNATTAAVVTADKPVVGGFSFGNPTSPPSSTVTFGQPSATNIFGGSTATNAETCIIKPSFSFGGATSPHSLTTTKSIFESPSATVLNNKNSFASLANATTNSNLQNKSFTFGTDNNNTIGAANTKPTTTVGGGFSFNLDNKSAGFTFGNSSFNASSNATAANSNVTPFAFSSQSNTSLTNEASKIANKTFSFESNTPNTSTTPSSNLFGTVANSGTGSSPFSFGTATNSSAPATAANSVAAANGNIFAPSPVSGNAVSGYGDRPIRRATRRLQKS